VVATWNTEVVGVGGEAADGAVGVYRGVLDVVTGAATAGVFAVSVIDALLSANDIEVAVVGYRGMAPTWNAEVVGVSGESADGTIGVDGGVLDVVTIAARAGVFTVGVGDAFPTPYNIEVAVVGDRGVALAWETEVVGVGSEAADGAVGVYGGVLDVVTIAARAGVFTVGVGGSVKSANNVEVAVIGY